MSTATEVADVEEVAKVGKLAKVLKTGNAIVKYLGPILPVGIGALDYWVARKEGKSTDQAWDDAKKGAIDAIIPGYADGFKDIKDDIKSKNWLDTTLDVAHTGTQAFMSVADTLAVVGDMSLLLGPEMIPVAAALNGVAAVANGLALGVDLLTDALHAVGATKREGIVYKLAPVVKGVAGWVGDKISEGWNSLFGHPDNTPKTDTSATDAPKLDQITIDYLKQQGISYEPGGTSLVTALDQDKLTLARPDSVNGARIDDKQWDSMRKQIYTELDVELKGKGNSSVKGTDGASTEKGTAPPTKEIPPTVPVKDFGTVTAHFDSNSARLGTDQERELLAAFQSRFHDDRVAGRVQLKLNILGSADGLGNQQHNLQLEQQRADYEAEIARQAAHAEGVDLKVSTSVADVNNTPKRADASRREASATLAS